MPMPPVNQCRATVSTTACQVKKNGAARQPTCRKASQRTFVQLTNRLDSRACDGFSLRRDRPGLSPRDDECFAGAAPWRRCDRSKTVPPTSSFPYWVTIDMPLFSLIKGREADKSSLRGESYGR